MSQEILSLAIFNPLPGKEADALATMRGLRAALSAGGYSHDRLYRDGNGQYVVVRYWKSEEARRAALEDSEVLRSLAKLSHEIEIVKIHERLDEVELG
jgi:heme-degrading monooxygenase HmoA